jgi:hypothetical protein
VILIVIGSREEFSSTNIKSFSEGKPMLAALVAIFAHWIYILYMQVKMFNVIRKESYTSLANAINSIGLE